MIQSTNIANGSISSSSLNKNRVSDELDSPLAVTQAAKTVKSVAADSEPSVTSQNDSTEIYPSHNYGSSKVIEIDSQVQSGPGNAASRSHTPHVRCNHPVPPDHLIETMTRVPRPEGQASVTNLPFTPDPPSFLLASNVAATPNPKKKVCVGNNNTEPAANAVATGSINPAGATRNAEVHPFESAKIPGASSQDSHIMTNESVESFLLEDLTQDPNSSPYAHQKREGETQAVSSPPHDETTVDEMLASLFMEQQDVNVDYLTRSPTRLAREVQASNNS